MMTSLVPGEAPVSLNEARGWLRLGATIDDAVIAALVRTAANICEAFVGQWLIVRDGEETLPVAAAEMRLTARPVLGVESVTLLSADGSESVAESGWRLRIAAGGAAWLSIDAAEGAADGTALARIRYRAGMAVDANGVPEAIRHGILRMMQHLHAARDGDGSDGGKNGGGAPPAMIAALWQPWRRMSLGTGR